MFIPKGIPVFLIKYSLSGILSEDVRKKSERDSFGIIVWVIVG
jgi:hypothetical protein